MKNDYNNHNHNSNNIHLPNDNDGDDATTSTSQREWLLALEKNEHTNLNQTYSLDQMNESGSSSLPIPLTTPNPVTQQVPSSSCHKKSSCLCSCCCCCKKGDGVNSSSSSSNRVIEYVRNPLDHSILYDQQNVPVTVDRILNTKPLQYELCTRPGPGNKKLTYLSGESVTRTLNDIFGYTGWQLQIIKTEQTVKEQDTKTNKWILAYLAHVRITHIQSGTYREDYGAGDSMDKHLPTAIQHAMKASITDGMKRTARHFGDKLGNILYHGNFSINNAPKTLQQALTQSDSEWTTRHQLHSSSTVPVTSTITKSIVPHPPPSGCVVKNEFIPPNTSSCCNRGVVTTTTAAAGAAQTVSKNTTQQQQMKTVPPQQQQKKPYHAQPIVGETTTKNSINSRLPNFNSKNSVNQYVSNNSHLQQQPSVVTSTSFVPPNNHTTVPHQRQQQENNNNIIGLIPSLVSKAITPNSMNCTNTTASFIGYQQQQQPQQQQKDVFACVDTNITPHLQPPPTSAEGLRHTMFGTSNDEDDVDVKNNENNNMYKPSALPQIIMDSSHWLADAASTNRPSTSVGRVSICSINSNCGNTSIHHSPNGNNNDLSCSPLPPTVMITATTTPHYHSMNTNVVTQHPQKQQPYHPLLPGDGISNAKKRSAPISTNQQRYDTTKRIATSNNMTTTTSVNPYNSAR